MGTLLCSHTVLAMPQQQGTAAVAANCSSCAACLLTHQALTSLRASGGRGAAGEIELHLRPS
jgi:hypothetical protein